MGVSQQPMKIGVYEAGMADKVGGGQVVDMIDTLVEQRDTRWKVAPRR